MISSPDSKRFLEAAHRFYGMGAFSEALDTLGRIPASDGREREFLLLNGACLARLRRAEQAVLVFTELLALDPDCHEALTWMALLTRNPRNMDEALGYARRAVALRPDDATGYGTLGSGYLSAHSPEPAIEAFQKAVELAPDVAEHRHNLALAYLMAHRHHEAIEQLRQGIALASGRPESYLVLATTYSLFGMTGQAIECLGEGLAQMPNNPSLHSSIAGAFASLRNDEAAERHHRRAVELSKDSRGGYATWLLNQGRFDESQAIFEAMIREKADAAFAYYGLMQSRKLKDSEADHAFVAEMESLLVSGTLRPRGEMYQRYALGRAEEQRKRFEAAMTHFDAANRLAFTIHRSGLPPDSASFAEEHRQTRERYESVRSSMGPGDSTEAPIFIIGMIRSGTTLLDQIVSSHSAVASGGEIRLWMEEGRRLVVQSDVPTADQLRTLTAEYVEYARLLAGSGERFTDKMPLNFAYAGLIHRAMPNARFIHIRRNAIDTCLSIWTTFFGQGAMFAYDKRNVVAYYREYLNAMAYWRKELPTDRLLEIDYEALISEPERVIPKIVEFLGLPWDDACLRHDQNQSAINTPSRWQARQPIYKSSVERWRSYEPWLGEFADLMEVP